MGDVFQSKDILKLKSHAIKHEDTTSYERDEERKVISVQGMYVVGVHRVPSYFDPGLLITDISTNEPDIVEYSEVAKQAFSDSTVEICDVNCNKSEIVSYSSITKQILDDSTIEIIDVNCNKSEIYFYSQIVQQAFSDSTVEICDINCNSSTIINEVIENTPRFDFGLRITNITTTHPTIST